MKVFLSHQMSGLYAIGGLSVGKPVTFMKYLIGMMPIKIILRCTRKAERKLRPYYQTLKQN